MPEPSDLNFPTYAGNPLPAYEGNPLLDFSSLYPQGVPPAVPQQVPPAVPQGAPPPAPERNPLGGLAAGVEPEGPSIGQSILAGIGGMRLQCHPKMGCWIVGSGGNEARELQQDAADAKQREFANQLRMAAEGRAAAGEERAAALQPLRAKLLMEQAKAASAKATGNDFDTDWELAGQQ